jgi:hypothetical protein
MGFEFDKASWSVLDKERDVRICALRRPAKGPGAWEAQAQSLEYNTFFIRKGALEVSFDVARIASGGAAKTQDLDPDGVTKPNTYSSFLLEDSLRDGLKRALRRTPTEAEHQEIKADILDGLSAFARHGKIDFPSVEFQVLCEDNMECLARKYPKRLPNYEGWAKAYNKTM